MTCRELLKISIDVLKKAGISSAVLDARILMKTVLNIDEAELIKTMNSPVSPASINKIKKLIARRAQNEPIAYIVGKKEFFGLDFTVNKNVLIPRPESEYLVERGIEFIKSKVHQVKSLNIIDIGTGSGNIIVSITKELYKLSNFTNFYATDISANALLVAKKNARFHSIDNINFIQSDLFNSIDDNIKFDLIIANLPYVPDSEQRTADSLQLKFEPQDAIFAKNNGTGIIKKFLSQATNRLTPHGAIMLELDPRNAKDIKKFAQKLFPYFKIELKKDLANLDRYLLIQSSQVSK